MICICQCDTAFKAGRTVGTRVPFNNKVVQREAEGQIKNPVTVTDIYLEISCSAVPFRSFCFGIVPQVNLLFNACLLTV